MPDSAETHSSKLAETTRGLHVRRCAALHQRKLLLTPHQDERFQLHNRNLAQDHKDQTPPPHGDKHEHSSFHDLDKSLCLNI